MFQFSTLRSTPSGSLASRIPANAAPNASRRSPLKTLIAAGAGLIGLALLLPWHLGRVQGHSMTPTFQPGSLFLYERGNLRPEQLQPGDIVVLRHAGELWIKRVYARAGDPVHFWHEHDGTMDHHIPIEAADLPRYERLAGWIRRHGSTRVELIQQRIPSDHVFVLGDGPTSVDSRTLGPIPTSQIVGRVLPLPGQNLEKQPESVARFALAL